MYSVATNVTLARNRKLLRLNQKGGILPLMVVSLLVIVGTAGLAIDSSHAFLNSTRLQNALDAAALGAAKTLNDSAGNRLLASAHGNEVFFLHLTGELAESVPTLTFEYSATLNPFMDSGNPPKFVRVSSDNYEVPIWFSSVLPGVDNQWEVSASAVAGPIPLSGGEVCDVAPMMVCGDASDTDVSDGTYFGLNYGNDASVQCLKYSSSVGGGGDSQLPEECDEPISNLGPGNFQLIQLSCGSGSDCIRQSLAGDHQSCLYEGGNAVTKPGNSVGPVAQGLNSRFGYYHGPVNSSDHPPDLVTTHPITYNAYQTAYFNEQFSNNIGSLFRRVMAVPIGDCSAAGESGTSNVPILGFGCYFLTEPTEQSGQSSWVKGHLIENCEVSGAPGVNPATLDGGYHTYKIILYNDPDGPAS